LAVTEADSKSISTTPDYFDVPRLVFDGVPINTNFKNCYSNDLDSMHSMLPDFFLQTLQNEFAVLASLSSLIL
jgi:hypothetical protein